VSEQDFTPNTEESMHSSIPPWLHVSPTVADAILSGKPMVALESTVITHGLPRPLNLDLAHQMERKIRDLGVVPATVGLYRGRVTLGLSSEELEDLALANGTQKISRRDFASARTYHRHGGTTVAATMYVAHAAGVQIFATGGIGGVHRGDSGDVSTDLPELSKTPVAVVCAGAKAILDLPRTLEWLETAGVPVIGWQTDEFPAFFSRASGLPVSARVDTVSEAATMLKAHWEMGFQSGVLICVPCPDEAQIPTATIRTALEQAEEAAAAAGISGQKLTPFLLHKIADLTGGLTVRANTALLLKNAEIAARIAEALG
jgi:pseudouridylate synthase